METGMTAKEHAERLREMARIGLKHGQKMLGEAPDKDWRQEMVWHVEELHDALPALYANLPRYREYEDDQTLYPSIPHLDLREADELLTAFLEEK